MRVAVMGAGSIGSYFGGTLARAGNQVSLIARGDHLAAIKAGGLRIQTDSDLLTIPCGDALEATDDPSAVGHVDLVLLTVKTYQNDVAVPAMLPMVGPDTSVLCLQNGIDSYRAAAQAVGEERVLPGAAYIEAERLGPGLVQQSGSVVRIAFGESDGSDSERGRIIENTLSGAGINAQFSQDIRQTLWTKFLFIATMAGVTSLSRETMAQIMPRPEWRTVIINCMKEIEAVARASGIRLDPDIVHNTVAYIEGDLEDMHASMHADIMAGRPLELEALNGAVVRAGMQAGVPTPINDVIYAALKPFAAGK
ncbi:MAG: 2-dehydropantoate 2-reductase [Chloroflexi bacterium]|nr:2-dehydropantoate 2-reductase [Chloroflexota bacterium]